VVELAASSKINDRKKHNNKFARLQLLSESKLVISLEGQRLKHARNWACRKRSFQGTPVPDSGREYVRPFCLAAEPGTRKEIMKSNTAAFFAAIVILVGLLAFEHFRLARTKIELARVSADLQTANAKIAGFETAAEKTSVAELAAQGKAALSGINYCEQVVGRDKLDLRSDGSAVWMNERDGQKLGSAKWTTDGSTVKIGFAEFKIEGSDLIDGKGNRWLHIR
jgi:hypothetical protein